MAVGTPIRIPTQADVDAGYAEMEAEVLKRAREYAARFRGYKKGAEVDVMREPLPPLAPPPPPPKVPVLHAICQFCDRVFTAKRAGMAVMTRNRHVKKDHAGQSLTRF